jgi:wobble nucleotide-excising tRNase
MKVSISAAIDSLLLPFSSRHAVHQGMEFIHDQRSAYECPFDIQVLLTQPKDQSAGTFIDAFKTMFFLECLRSQTKIVSR